MIHFLCTAFCKKTISDFWARKDISNKNNILNYLIQQITLPFLDQTQNFI